VSAIDRARVGRYARAGGRWARLLTRGRSKPGLRLFYGHDRVPEAGEPVAGGTAKFQRLATRFPNHPTDFTLLYLGSTWLPRDLRPLLRLTRRRGVPVVLNQNGVGYPGWAGEDTDAFNRSIRRALEAADHVLYQSAFCKRSADEWVCAPSGSWEILHNAVDIDHFTPAERASGGGPVILLGGDQYQAYRLELGLRTLASLLRTHPDAQLLVTGRLVVPVEPLASELGVLERVQVLGRYSQREAPDVFRRAHVLLHTKVNDPCPSLVLEAMACGLPIVYPASGGVPELVGEDAGIGVPHLDGFDRDEPPEPDALADAVVRVLGDRGSFAAAARARAVDRFALEPWLDRHAELFETLLPTSGRG
jgi:glycosyltransferase involved in cell wall biosynthesis